MTTGVSPLLSEWLHALLFPIAGVLLFLLGRRIAGLPSRPRKTISISVVAVQLIAIVAYFNLLPMFFRSALDWAGGVMEIAGCASLLIFGVAHEKLAKGVLAMAVTFLLAVVTVFASIPLYWHYLAQNAIANVPDEDGLLVQSTHVTCAPASGAMLLHAYGIKASEGLVAERAGTDMRGTDQYMLMSALNSIVGEHGMKAMTGFVDLEEAAKLGRPFVACIDLPKLGLHDVVVNAVKSDGVLISDPMYGMKELIPTADFLKMWRHNIVWLSEPPVK